MRLIKRYSNRKLYDTATRTYITLESLTALVMEGVEIKVVDNDSEEDITTVVLSQLLLERERTRRSLPSGLLSGLLRGSETLSRGLSNLTRPLESEIERSFKFWLDLAEDREDEVLRLIENLLEHRRRAKTNLPDGPSPRPMAPLGLNLLRRRDLDDFETWETPTPPSAPDPATQELAAQLTEQANQLGQLLAETRLDLNQRVQFQADLQEILERLNDWLDYLEGVSGRGSGVRE